MDKMQSKDSGTESSGRPSLDEEGENYEEYVRTIDTVPGGWEFEFERCFERLSGRLPLQHPDPNVRFVVLMSTGAFHHIRWRHEHHAAVGRVMLGTGYDDVQGAKIICRKTANGFRPASSFRFEMRMPRRGQVDLSAYAEGFQSLRTAALAGSKALFEKVGQG